MQGPSGSGSSGSDSGKQAPPPYPVNQMAPNPGTPMQQPMYPAAQNPGMPMQPMYYPAAQNPGTPMQPMYPAAQNPGMPMQPMYPPGPNAGTPMQSMYPAGQNPGMPMQPMDPAAPPMHPPPQMSPQVEVQYVPKKGGCKFCGGFITHEYDSGILACAIIMSIICFPCGLLTFCCIDKEPKCIQCGKIQPARVHRSKNRK